MCIICEATILINHNITYDFDKFKDVIKIRCCRNVIKIPYIKNLKELNCSFTQILKIPNIKGLQILNYSSTSIISIPNIKGINIILFIILQKLMNFGIVLVILDILKL